MSIHTHRKTIICDKCNKYFDWKKNIFYDNYNEINNKIHKLIQPNLCNMCDPSIIKNTNVLKNKKIELTFDNIMDLRKKEIRKKINNLK